MYSQIKISAHIIIVTILFVGCSYQREIALPPVDMPEGVFSIPRSNNYGAAKVGIFAFTAPPYAKGEGGVAARFLCQELEQEDVFAEVINLSDIRDMTMGNLIDTARTQGYDLIITGELLYYFEGTFLEPSSVTEEIRVVEVSGGDPQTLWHAKAKETAPPALSTDYIIAQGKGAPAPSTELLMKRNAQKFSNMILGLPPRAIQGTYSGMDKRLPHE